MGTFKVVSLGESVFVKHGCLHLPHYLQGIYIINQQLL